VTVKAKGKKARSLRTGIESNEPKRQVLDGSEREQKKIGGIKRRTKTGMRDNESRTGFTR